MKKKNDYIIKNFWLILAVLLVLIFREVFVSLVDKVLVNPFLSRVQSNIFNDILFFILSILTGYVIANINIRDYILAFLGLIASYLVIRFSGYWSFKEFSVLAKYNLWFDSYTDLLFWASFIGLGINYYQKKKKKSKSQTTHKEKNNAIGFIIDSPITKYKQDEQKRSDLVSSLLKFIKHTDISNSALTIGISGDWGVGKTSFLNLLKERIQRLNQYKNKGKSIIINFSPWLYLEDTKQSLERIFLDSLYKSISQEIPKYKLKRQLKKYIHLVAGSYLHPLIKIFDSIINNESLENLKQEINQSLREANICIYIFIDDLDRLDTKEIVQLMKLIRNTADFANTVYFVAYDRNYVNEALKEINRYNYEKYLDKIFQFELNLTVDYDLILGQLKHEMEEISKRIKDKILSKKLPDEELRQKLEEQIREEIKFIDEFIKDMRLIPILEDFDANKKKQVTTSIENSSNLKDLKKIRDYFYFTPRLLKKFINSFMFYASKLGENYEFKDLFYILLIKHKYPIVYNDLFLHPQMYFQTKNDFYYALDNDRTKKRLELLRLPNFKIDAVLEILDWLCKDAERKGEFSICFRQTFYSYNVGYFTILTEKEFLEAFYLPEKEFLKKVDYWIEEATKQSQLEPERKFSANELYQLEFVLNNKLKRIIPENKVTYLKVLKAIFLLYNKTRYNSKPDMFTNEVLFARFKTLFVSLISQFQDIQIIITALEATFYDKIKSSQYNWAELMLLLDIKNDKLDLEPFIKEELKKHFSQKEDILFRMIELYLNKTQFNGDFRLVISCISILGKRNNKGHIDNKTYIDLLKSYLKEDCHKIENFFKSQGWSSDGNNIVYTVKKDFEDLYKYKDKCPNLKKLPVKFK